MEPNRMLFPLFVDLRDKRAVVVGGGTVAARRTGVLLRFGARVRVVAPQVKERLEGAEYVLRPYAPGDLTGADLAVAVTGNAGPEPSEGKPVGLVYVAVDSSWHKEVLELNLNRRDGDARELIRYLASSHALHLLLRTAQKYPGASEISKEQEAQAIG